MSRCRRDRVVHVLDDLHVGGAQQLVLTAARVAADRGAPLTVLSLKADDGGRVGRQLRSLGADVVEVPRPDGRAGAARQLGRLLRVLVRRRPAAVQTHLTMANVLGGVAGRLAGATTVATLHNTRVGEDGNSPLALRLERVVLRRVAHRVVAVGGAVEAAHRERLAPARSVVVVNAAEPAAVLGDQQARRLREELTGDADRPLVLAVGRLVPQKGYGDLLDAWESVLRAHQAGSRRPVLVVLGDGDLADALRRRVERSGLGGSVRLLGSRDDVREVMAVADVYVSASLWEGLPVALLEAMTAGLPVVTTDVGDVPGVVDETCGLLSPAGSPQQLAEHVVALLGDPARAAALGAAAARRAQERFGAAPWFDRLLEVYGLPPHS